MAAANDISELFTAHRGLVSDRITERKKSATLLRDLLDSDHVIDFITASSSGQLQTKGKSRNQTLTWSALFRNVVGYVLKEAEAVAKTEDKGTRSSSALHTKKKDMSDMLRTYIRAANKRGPHMCVGEVVEHILTVLKNPKMVVWMCGEYSHMLLHYVLQRPHCVVQISSSAWNELIIVYGSLFLSPPSSCDRTLLSRILLSLLSLSSTQCDLDAATLYNFFSQVMPKIAKEKSPKILENLLLSFVSYSSVTASNSRGRLCNLGEAIFSDILHLWGHCQLPVGVQIISLLRFQIRIHHPRGCHDDASGGWAANDAQWKKNLEHLYKLIIAEFENASHKLQWSGKGEMGSKPELIDLAADVINQIMYIRDERVTPGNPALDNRHRDKRLRPQTCWTSLRDGLSANTDSPSLNIWLQLTAWLVAKWPASFSTDDAHLLLTQLVEILGETKRTECLAWLFTCLNVLALHPSTKHIITTTHPHNLTEVHRDLWRKVWIATVKSVGVHNAEEEGYALLTAMVEQRLLERDREPWQLLSQIVSGPRRPLVAFLASLISKYRLPESLGSHPSPLTPPTITTSTPSPVTPSHSTECTYPLRVRLLRFLVQTTNFHGNGGEVGGGESEGRGGTSGENALQASLLGACSSVDVSHTRPPISLSAHILVALTQRSCSALQQKHLDSHTVSIKERVRLLLGLQETPLDHLWRDIEELYLESTFDIPVKGQGLTTRAEPVVYPRVESPIPSLLSLLLELLGNRAEKLLQPITLEATVSSRDKVHSLLVAMETQAYHCTLTVHVLFLLGVASGRSFSETMLKSLSIKLLPNLLQKVSAGLRDAVWNEVERSEYNQAVVTILQTLTQLLIFESESQRLSLECVESVRMVEESVKMVKESVRMVEESVKMVKESVRMVMEVVCGSFPRDLLSTCLKITLRKPTLPPQPSSRPSSTFSITTSSSASHHPSPSPSPSLPRSSFTDDDMDIGTHDSDPATLGDTPQTSLTDLALPSEQTQWRMEAAAFVVHWHRLVTSTSASVVAVGDHSGTRLNQTGETFDSTNALLSLLSDECIRTSKPEDVQMAFHICRLIASCNKITSFLEAIMEVVSQVLTQHRKSQSVLCESLKLLQLLARHFGRGEERGGGEGGGGGCDVSEECSAVTVPHLKTILSAFWSLYMDGALSVPVRLQFASTLRVYLTFAAECGNSLTLSVRKRKKSDTAPEDVSIRDALLMMIDDPDHAVRMHMAKVVTSLHRVAGGNELVAREEQLKIFQRVSEMLKKAHMVSTDQDDLSREDDSVNRVSSMITTLQYQTCVSPACEAAVLAELAMAVGHGFIDDDLVSKALGQVSRFLGYRTTGGFMKDHLLSMVSDWLEKGQTLDKFPYQLFGNSSLQEFFVEHADVVTPLLVYLCDEASLLSLSSLLPSPSLAPLPSLLSRSLPSSLSLILPSFAQRDSSDSEVTSEERRTRAHASHDLLTRHLSEEEIAESMKTRMADFVIHLLLRLFEPHSATSHLARYSKASDPEPVLPHFSSMAVRATLDYIASCYGGSSSVSAGHPFMRQLARRRDNIQRILLSLVVAMETTHRPFKQRQLLQSYALFVSLISDQLAEGLEEIIPFIVMDVIHAVIRLLNCEAKRMMAGGREGEGEGGREGEEEGERDYGSERGGCVEEKIVSLCFHILTTLIRAALGSCPEELGRHLQVVVTTLVTFARSPSSGENLNKQAMQLLKLLLLTPHESPVLTRHLSQLDPLPDDGKGELFRKFRDVQQQFREISDQLSLEQEINRFVEVGVYLPLSTRGPGLCRLTDMIRDRRSDVTELLGNSNRSDSILRLIQVLVGVANGDETTPTVATEMGRCLGELGGLDLHCIALPTTPLSGSFNHSSLPNGWSPVWCYTAHLLFLLTSLLRDTEVSVVEATHNCLHRVLATKTAATILSKMEDMFTCTAFLQPFRTQKKGASSHVAIAPPTTPVSLDTPSLWIPQYRHGNTGNSSVVHESWITGLVMGIIDSGGMSDPTLLLVKPVCQVKVSFCESVFPYLILNLLWEHEDLYRPIISRHFRTFFSTAATSPSSFPSPSRISPSSPFSQSSQHRSPLFPSSLSPPPPASVRIMLNTVMFLRTINRPKLKKSTLWDNNFWLDLDFLDVAMAAQRCSAYFTSLLYIEIWHGAKYDSSCQNDTPEAGAKEEAVVSMDTTTGQTGLASLEDPRVQQLLLEAYCTNISDPDSLYGVCASKTVSKETWMHLYEQEGHWDKSLSAYNLQMNLPSPNCQASLVGSLQSLGLTHVLNMYLTGVGVASPQSMQDLSRFQYEAAWRCSIWEDQNICTLAQPGSYTGYHRHLCDSLLALRDGESGLLAASLSTARAELLGTLCTGSQEGCSRIYHSLSQLLCLCELEEAGGEDRRIAMTSQTATTPLSFLTSWDDRLKCLDADFSYLEPVLSLRAATLHSLLLRDRMRASGSATTSGSGGGTCSNGVMDLAARRRIEQLFVSLCDTLLTLAKRAQDVGRYQVAEGALFSLKHLHNSRTSHSVPASIYPSLSWKHQLQEAKLHWGRGETSLALGQLRGLLQRLKMLQDPPVEVSSLYPSALCLYGSWLAQTHSENPAAIMKLYLEQSVALMEKQQTSDLGPILHAYLMLARYADSQYQRVTRHMTSSSYESKKQLLEKSKLELSRLSMTMSTEARTRDRHVRTLMAQIEEDDVAMTSLEEDRQQFLEKALHNYIHCLRTGDEHDLRVFRLCALWFANANDRKVNTIITEGSAQLESRKFLPLLYQLAARMSARSLATDPFQHTLQEIIFRASVDHPYHSLYVTLALSHASMDDTFPATGHVTGTKAQRGTGRLGKKTSLTTRSTVDEDKVKAARDLIRRLHSEKPSLVHSMEQLCEAYIDLAYHDVSAHRKERKPIKFPASCTLVKLGGQLKDVAVPTVNIEVDPSCSYSNLVTIDKFDTHFQLAGGINLPKVLSCTGSDGRRRRQLVKGKDDLRQDAVMQQVFVLVNKLLQKEHTTSKRKLNIRTYKVIPLSQRSGIVEWCEGTTPLGEYLIGPQKYPTQGAHSRYRPQDWPSLDCRKKLMEAGSKRGSSKFETYADITRHFRPVFHHFFMERFPCPSEWFERRLMYTRSVATSSIVGYVVGLGDRHVQNILIDTNTAEFIHIDLGVAFEQGRTLPTPETVPFRLTRDIVDGMGVAGVEGVFRRCCEKTMEVMRASHEELRTIVEVLLYDPLYMWTISPVKALNLQRRADGDDSNTTGGGGQIFEGDGTGGMGNGSNPTNKMAERVLLRLQEKLEGIEDGVPLSVGGQVNQLIQEATDPSNLCLLFPGWQAWI